MGSVSDHEMLLSVIDQRNIRRHAIFAPGRHNVPREIRARDIRSDQLMAQGSNG